MGPTLASAVLLAILVAATAEAGRQQEEELGQQLSNSIHGAVYRRELLKKKDEKLVSGDDGGGGGNGRQASPKIVGGTVAPCGRYPFMVSLRDRTNEHKCGAVLIDPHWVLTAAHCVDPNNEGSLGMTPVTVVGACNLNDKTNDAGVVEMFIPRETIIHEDFTGDVMQGADIALLRLAVASNHTPISLPSGNVNAGISDPLVVLGWGEGPSGDKLGDLHQGTNMQVVPNDICGGERIWGPTIKDGMLCAFAINFDGDTCAGDSGGPVLRAFAPGGKVAEGSPELDVIFGVTSFGEKETKCGESLVPGVYSSVPYYVNWINDKIKGSREPTPEAATPPGGAPLEPEVPSPLPGPLLEPAVPEPAITLVAVPEPAPSIVPVMAPAEAGPGEETEEGTLADVVDTAAVDAPAPAPAYRPQEIASPPMEPSTDFLTIGGVHKEEILKLASGKEKNDSTSALSDLLSDGGDPNACCTHLGRSALHETTQHDNAGAAEALLTHGALPDVVDQQGQTPLHLAGTRNAPSVAELLIAAGADVNAADGDGETPLHDAAEWGRWRVAEVLLAGGADKEAVDKAGRTPFAAICTNRCTQNSRQTKKLQQLLLVL